MTGSRFDGSLRRFVGFGIGLLLYRPYFIAFPLNLRVLESETTTPETTTERATTERPTERETTTEQETTTERDETTTPVETATEHATERTTTEPTPTSDANRDKDGGATGG